MRFRHEDSAKILNDLISRLEHHQAMSLKDDMDGRMSGLKSPSSIPKNIAMEKISILAKPKNHDDEVDEAIADQKNGQVEDLAKSKMPGEEDMTDEELEELLKRHLK